ncbi:MAG: Hsp20/alpha crystallin family protein [Methylococcales bacterium]
MSLRNFENLIWAEACELLNRADRLQRQFFRPVMMATKQPVWEPPIDLYETSSEILVMAALPGVAPEQLRVSKEGNHLCIVGHRYLPADAQCHIRRLEIPYGRFERTIELPTDNFEVGNFEFAHGCLLVPLRKI